MDLLQITINCLAEIALFIGVVIFLLPQNMSLFSKRFVFAIGMVVVVNIIFQLTFLNKLSFLQIAVAIINYSKFVFLTAFVVKVLRLKNALLCLIIQLLSSLISTGFRLVVVSNLIPETTVIDDIILLIASVLLSIILILSKRKSKGQYIDEIIQKTPNYIYILVLLSIFIGCFLVKISDYITDDFALQMRLIEILTFSIIVILITVISLLLFSAISKNYYKEVNSILKKQTDAQLQFYKRKEKSNKEIRQFKHDYNNHINCIQAMLKAERYDEVSTYLCNISNSFPSDRFQFNTGNFIADAILSDKQELCAPDDITISFDGVIEKTIDSTDLCVVLSNALDNAIEATRSCKENKCITVRGGFQQGYSVMVIRNPVLSETKASLSTTKLDKENHGFGLINIRRVVEKYDGRMNIDCKNNAFTLSVMLNIKSSNTVTN